MDNSASSHVEIILSFILFVSAITGMIIILNPFSENSFEKIPYENIKTVVVENISVGVHEIALITDAREGKIKIGIGAGGAVVKNSSGDKIESDKVGEDLCFETSSDGFFYVYLSEGIEYVKGEIDCSTSEASEYKILSETFGNYFSYSRIIKLKNAYDSDYLALKNELKIDDKNDFSFGFEYGEFNLSTDRTKTGNSPVISKRIRGNAIAGDEIGFADISVSAW